MLMLTSITWIRAKIRNSLFSCIYVDKMLDKEATKLSKKMNFSNVNK